jgi:phosphatidylglycerol:prolipoprotein diacylglycerol transferase
MFPEVFRIGNIVITSFGVMMVFSFLVGGIVLGRQLERYGLSRQLAWDLMLWIMIGGLAGAKLYYHFLHWDELVARPAVLFSRGGLVWYGGLIGGVLGYYFGVRRRGLPLAIMYDATAPALAVAYAVGRMGCFLVGDDYGLPTDSWVGIAFPNGAPPSTAGNLREVGADIPPDIPDAQVLAVHPTQLYEVALGLLMFAYLWPRGKRPHRQGQLFGSFAILYAVERFLIEFVRAKGDRILLGLSTSQIASILLLAVGIWLVFGRRAAAPAPLTDPSSPPPASSRPRPAGQTR